MQRVIKTILICSLLFISTASLGAKGLGDKEFRVELAKQTNAHYSLIGINRGWQYYMPFVNSSYRVASYFPNYPAKDNYDRVKLFYCMGANESFLKYNFVNLNIPGVKYASGKVKKFSVDYSWIGLNEENITWTYQVAKSIQNNKKIDNKYASKKTIKLLSLEGTRIPKQLHLRRMSLDLAKDARKQYLVLKRQGKTPKYINNNIVASFVEREPDDLDSALIYRVIVETDRQARGWDYNLQDEALYKWLK